MLSYIYYYKQSSNDLTGISRKKSPPHLVSLIKVDPHNHSSWYKDSAYVHVATFIIYYHYDIGYQSS